MFSLRTFVLSIFFAASLRYDPNATMLRPYLDPDVCGTGTASGAWDEYTRRQYPKFDGWNEISRQLMTDSDPTNDLSPTAAQQLFRWQHRRKSANDQPNYDVDASFGGPVPFIGKQLGDSRFFTSYKTQREMLLVPLSRPDYKDYRAISFIRYILYIVLINHI